MALTYSHSLDSFRITRNANSSFFYDSFGNGIAPATGTAPEVSAGTPTYGVNGVFTEAGGRLLFTGANAELIEGSIIDNTVGQTLLARTNISTDLTQGLKNDDDVTVEAIFDIVSPGTIYDRYGVRLMDRLQGGTGSPPDQLGDNVVNLVVSHNIDDTVTIKLVQQNFVAGTLETLASTPLNPPAGATQIALRLHYDTTAVGDVIASFDYLNAAGTVLSSMTFAPRGHIFGSGTATTADDEVWTRAQVYSFATPDTQVDTAANPTPGQLVGGVNNDTLIGMNGNDTLDGATGTDVAVYRGRQSDYTITTNANGSVTVQDNRSSGLSTFDGTDTLHNIESLRFSDGQHLVLSGSLNNAAALLNLLAANPDIDPLLTLPTQAASATTLDLGAATVGLTVSITGGGVANLTTGSNNDVITSSDLSGGVVHSGSGNDIVDLGATIAALTSGGAALLALGSPSGADLIFGEAGNDNLSSGAGNDTLDGGAGIDSFDGGDRQRRYLLRRSRYRSQPSSAAPTPTRSCSLQAPHRRRSISPPTSSKRQRPLCRYRRQRLDLLRRQLRQRLAQDPPDRPDG